MSVPFSGTFRRSGGVVSAIGKQLKSVNLKSVKRINVKFDPFHENATPTRDFLFHITSPRIALSNSNCIIKTEVVSDRSDPSISFSLVPAAVEQSQVKTITFKSGNLNTLELLQLLNKHISSLAPKEEPVNTLKTKSEKKAGGGGKGGKRK